MAVVDDVTVMSGDLVVTDVSVRRPPQGPYTIDGGPCGTLRDLGFHGGTTVTGQCARSPNPGMVGPWAREGAGPLAGTGTRGGDRQPWR